MERLYVYAIAGGAAARDLGRIGLEGARVTTCSAGVLGALVSAAPVKLRPERRQLAAHQEVLKALMKDPAGGILPVAFGVVADSSAALKRVLTGNREVLEEQLRRVAGRVEMGLRVGWDVPNIFEYFVRTQPELREARDRLLGGRGEPAQEAKIEVGRLFDRLLDEERERLTERVERVIGRRSVEVKRNRPRNEREVMNLACLVEQSGVEGFEGGVMEAARLFDNSFSFDYSGPWAPHNFVDVKLDL